LPKIIPINVHVNKLFNFTFNNGIIPNKKLKEKNIFFWCILCFQKLLIGQLSEPSFSSVAFWQLIQL
jgi:hypothetical protein